MSLDISPAPPVSPWARPEATVYPEAVTESRTVPDPGPQSEAGQEPPPPPQPATQTPAVRAAGPQGESGQGGSPAQARPQGQSQAQPPAQPPVQPPVQPSARSAAALAGDERRVKRASTHVGLYVGFATALVLLAIAAFFIVTVFSSSSARLVINTTGRAGPGFPPATMEDPHVEYLVDPTDIIVPAIILCVLGVALMAAVGALTARRAVKPLADALNLQRHFVADASHELRTPLTVLSTRVQLLQRRLDRGEDPAPVVAKLKDDAATMNDVLNDLLLTVEDSGAQTLTPLRPRLEEAVGSLQVIAQEAQVKLTLQARANPTVAVPPRSLTRAVVALVDNAIQHSPAGAPVEVTLDQQGSDALIRVRDHGPGIEGTDPDRMFERFAHGQETGRKRSFGLGLALVSEIAQRSRGDITVESTGPTGTTFLLRLPTA